LEEIVGDIQDEYDEELEGVNRIKEGGAIVRGEVAIRDLNRAMDWKLPDDEGPVTIAGLVIHESQTIPNQGQVFAYHGYRFEILTKQRNQIQSLRVEKTYEPDQRAYGLRRPMSQISALSAIKFCVNRNVRNCGSARRSVVRFYCARGQQAACLRVWIDAGLSEWAARVKIAFPRFPKLAHNGPNYE